MRPSTRRKTVRLAIIGTGSMANHHAEQFRETPGCRIVAACDIHPERARAFAAKHKVPRAFGSTEELIEFGDFDAVSVVTPDTVHATVSIACLAAGRHVLCEKPLAVSYTQARRMVAATKRAGTVNMVNFSYRDWPCIQAATAAVAGGFIGEIRHVEASYLQSWLPSKIWGDWRTSDTWLWRLSTAHGSKGVLGDIGVHILDYAMLPAGPVREISCRLKTFSKAPGDRIGQYVLDANDSAVMHAEFRNGALGVLHVSRWAGGHKNRLYLKLCGTLGTIEMDSEVSTTSYRICNGPALHTADWQTVECPPVPTNYERFINAIQSGHNGTPDFQRGAEVQRVLDACFESDAIRRAVRIGR